MNRSGYEAIFYFLGRYKLLNGTIFLLSVVSAILESLSVVAFFPVFVSLLPGEPGEPAGILGLVTGVTEFLPIADPVIAASVLLISVFIVKTAFNLLRELLIAYSGAKVLYDVKRQIMDRYATAHYQFISDNKQGTLLYNLLDAPSAISGLLLKGPQMAVFLLRIIAIMLVLLSIFPIAALAFSVMGLGYYAVTHYLSRRVSFFLGKGRAEAATEQTILSNEFISGFRQIIAFNTSRRWVDGFNLASKRYSDLHRKDQAWLATPRPVMELFAIGLILGFVLISRLSTGDNSYQDLATLGVFATALIQVLPSLASFGRLRMEVMGSLPNADLAYKAITSPVPRRREGHRDVELFTTALTFENVSFAYPERGVLLKNLNISFEKGQVTAVVGPSGAGKTTLINLILGLFEPTKGRITLDGVPIHDLKRDSWLAKIGFVSQDSFLFHSTIADNIIFGREGRSFESVVHAAQIANAHGFISELTQGYETIVGDRGMRLSGGQQQRLAIARAMLDDPEVLIFDEATSSLDTISERHVQDAIDSVSTDRTVILIAHRLSTVQKADKIVVIDDGRVVEEGTHEGLLTKQGHYSDMVAASSR